MTLGLFGSGNTALLFVGFFFFSTSQLCVDSTEARCAVGVRVIFQDCRQRTHLVTSFKTCRKISERQYTLGQAISTCCAAAMCNQKCMPCLQQMCLKGFGHIFWLLMTWVMALSGALILWVVVFCVMASQAQWKPKHTSRVGWLV